MDVPRVSATQISLWRECKRKWAFRYLERIKIPPTKGALLGTETQDEQIDPYLGEGRPFDFSKKTSAEIALALSPLLPKPWTPGMVLRRKFEIPSPTGQIVYIGEFDIWLPDSRAIPGLEDAPPVTAIQDIKTTKDLKYAKDVETLKTDVQANIYAMASMFLDGVNELELVWTSGRTRPPHRAVQHHLRVLAPHVCEQFERLDAVAVEIGATYRAKPKIEDIPPEPTITPDDKVMCEAYGGCPYFKHCNPSPAVYAEAWRKHTSPMSDATQKLLENLRKGNPHPMGKRNVDLETAPAPNPFEVKAPTELPKWATEPGINPPEKTLPPAPPVGAAAPTPPAPPVEEPKAKRGRPAKVAEVAAEVSDPQAAALEHFVGIMKKLGIKVLTLAGVHIELA